MMANCGYTGTRSGKPCGRVAGWGTAHKGVGMCKPHQAATIIDPASIAMGRIKQAPQYRINDGLYYGQTMPVPLPYTVTQQGAEKVQAFVLREWSQRSSMRFGFDPPYRTKSDGPVWMPSEDPLMEWDAQTRQGVLTECHAAFHRNPVAKAAIRLTRYFAVGKGHTVTCRNQDVQAVIDRFRANEENAVHEYDKTFVEDLFVDGELFIRKVPGDADNAVIVPVPPWHIPDIATAKGFLRRVEGYHLMYSHMGITRSGEMVPDSVDEWLKPPEVLHVAINRHSYELRGRSDLFTILPWLGAYKDWLENRARQNQWRGALLWDVSIDAQPGDVKKAQSNYATPPTPGSIVAHSAKETWQALSNPVAAGDASEDGRQIKLMAAVGVQLPEYMLSDGENANLASATAQEMPALHKFVDVQQIMNEQVWTPIYTWVIEQAIADGSLDAEVEIQDSDGDPIVDDSGETETVAAVDAFTVAFPELQEDDPKTLAEALQIAVLNKWVSNETASAEMGFDWAQEQKRIAREDDKARDDAAQGRRIDMPEPDGGDDGTDEEATAAE